MASQHVCNHGAECELDHVHSIFHFYSLSWSLRWLWWNQGWLSKSAARSWRKAFSTNSRLRTSAFSPLWHSLLVHHKNPVGDDQLNDLANKIHGGAATVGNTALVRRLHFEACAFLMADMKTQVSATDPSEPVRKLPFVEKQTSWNPKNVASLVCYIGLSNSLHINSLIRYTIW